jgi:hypothetical protein
MKHESLSGVVYARMDCAARGGQRGSRARAGGITLLCRSLAERAVPSSSGDAERGGLRRAQGRWGWERGEGASHRHQVPPCAARRFDNSPVQPALLLSCPLCHLPCPTLRQPPLLDGSSGWAVTLCRRVADAVQRWIEPRRCGCLHPLPRCRRWADARRETASAAVR